MLEENRGFASKLTYQKVAFYRGLELFLDTEYPESIEVFDRSLAVAQDEYFRSRTLYWKAETAYQLRQFDQARDSYLQFGSSPQAQNTSEYADLHYQLGYTYFKLKDYRSASSSFTTYLNKSSDKAKVNDASMRLGDSHFVGGNYQEAISAYQRVVSNSGAKRDYASYQIAMSHGFIGNNLAKIEELNSFISRYPNSKLRDDALFELAGTYVRTDQENKGMQVYERLVNQYSDSKLIPQTLLRQGLVHYNANRNDDALVKLKSLVKNYPNSQEAIQAVATAKLIYVDLGRVNEFASWVEELDFVEVSDSELEQASYESADKKYREGNTSAAIKAYGNYIEEFPNGKNALEANFRLAQLLYGEDKKDQALTYFAFVANLDNNMYTEQALTRAAEIHLEADDYDKALPYLQKLESSAEIQQNITFAQSNLMKIYYSRDNDSKTIAYAEKVLANNQIDDRIKSDAQIMIARSAIRTGDEAKAKIAYREVLKIAQGRLAAEALYYDAYFKNQEGLYQSSNDAVQKLAKDYSSYKEWGAKGLVIMARNFYALDDAFQATYILENVIKNFEEFTSVVEEAKLELALIKSKEAQRNSDVLPEEN